MARLAEKKFQAEAISDISGVSLDFAKDFMMGYSKEKAAALSDAILGARNLKDIEPVRQHFVRHLHQYGFSMPVLGSYFKKQEKEIEKIVA